MPPESISQNSESRDATAPESHASHRPRRLVLYREARKPVALTEALCWAHGRRNFFKLAQLAKAPLAIEAVRQIDTIFDLERTINGLPQEQRRAIRQDKLAPLVTDLENWMRDVRRKLSRHVEVAKAIDYMLKRWSTLR